MGRREKVCVVLLGAVWCGVVRRGAACSRLSVCVCALCVWWWYLYLGGLCVVAFVPGCDCGVLHQDTCCKKYICVYGVCMHIRHRNGNGKVYDDSRV